jgi:hypothetical protein
MNKSEELKDIKIEIRPIPNKKDIREYSEMLEHVSAKHILAPYLEGGSNNFATGLKKEDIEYLKKAGCPYDLNPLYEEEKPSFWLSEIVKVQLLPSPIFLFPYRSVLDYIKWKYLLVSNYIYTSEEEIATGTKPEATHYIYDAKETVKLKAKEIEDKNSLIMQISKLSLERKRTFVLLLLNENTENFNEDELVCRFDDILANKDLKAQLIELLNADDATVSLKAIVKIALNKQVLKRTREGIFWFETKIGFREDNAIEFLSKPENQDILLGIKEKIINYSKI